MPTASYPAGTHTRLLDLGSIIKHIDWNGPSIEELPDGCVDVNWRATFWNVTQNRFSLGNPNRAIVLWRNRSVLALSFRLSRITETTTQALLTVHDDDGSLCAGWLQFLGKVFLASGQSE